jgi:thiamine-phosphate pyrophosphorylase
MVLGRLQVIVNVSVGDGPGAAVALADTVAAAGAPIVQLRAKGLTDAELFDLATAVQGVCAGHGTALIVNDRADVALAVGAAGAHVGDEDLPLAAARRVLGQGAILGATARDLATARRAVAAGATYVGVGPCYVTTTKAGLPEPLGPAGIAAVAGQLDAPVIAIAGVTVDRVPELLAAGAYGVAVVGAVAGAADPAVATKELLAALERGANR